MQDVIDVQGFAQSLEVKAKIARTEPIEGLRSAAKLPERLARIRDVGRPQAADGVDASSCAIWSSFLSSCIACSEKVTWYMVPLRRAGERVPLRASRAQPAWIRRGGSWPP